MIRSVLYHIPLNGPLKASWGLMITGRVLLAVPLKYTEVAGTGQNWVFEVAVPSRSIWNVLPALQTPAQSLSEGPSAGLGSVLLSGFDSSQPQDAPLSLSLVLGVETWGGGG